MTRVTLTDDIVLDVREEWLVRNALSCYRDQCEKTERAERDEAETNALANPEYARACEQLAAAWRETIKRIEALEEKLQ